MRSQTIKIAKTLKAGQQTPLPKNPLSPSNPKQNIYTNSMIIEPNAELLLLKKNYEILLFPNWLKFLNLYSSGQKEKQWKGRETLTIKIKKRIFTLKYISEMTWSFIIKGTCSIVVCEHVCFNYQGMFTYFLLLIWHIVFFV